MLWHYVSPEWTKILRAISVLPTSGSVNLDVSARRKTKEKEDE